MREVPPRAASDGGGGGLGGRSRELTASTGALAASSSRKVQLRQTPMEVGSTYIGMKKAVKHLNTPAPCLQLQPAPRRAVTKAWKKSEMNRIEQLLELRTKSTDDAVARTAASHLQWQRPLRRTATAPQPLAATTIGDAPVPKEGVPEGPPGTTEDAPGHEH